GLGRPGGPRTARETRGVWGGPHGTPQLKSEREFTSRERRNSLTLRGNACYGHLLIPSRPSLSIFFPAYNDAGTIASLAIVAHMTARELTGDYEVIVVDDGGPDHTGLLLDEMVKSFPWLKVVHHEKNRRYGGALRSGFDHASK